MNLNKLMPIAMQVAQLSKDPRTKVAALVVDHRGAVRALGYNGFPRGIEDKPEWLNDRQVKNMMVAHAEANAIANAAAVGTPLEGCAIVVTKFPCRECAKLIINAGIKHVHSIEIDIESDWVESNSDASRMFDMACVKVTTMKPSLTESVK